MAVGAAVSEKAASPPPPRRRQPLASAVVVARRPSDPSRCVLGTGCSIVSIVSVSLPVCFLWRLYRVSSLLSVSLLCPLGVSVVFPVCSVCQSALSVVSLTSIVSTFYLFCRSSLALVSVVSLSYFQFILSVSLSSLLSVASLSSFVGVLISLLLLSFLAVVSFTPKLFYETLTFSPSLFTPLTHTCWLTGVGIRATWASGAWLWLPFAAWAMCAVPHTGKKVTAGSSLIADRAISKKSVRRSCGMMKMAMQQATWLFAGAVRRRGRVTEPRASSTQPSAASVRVVGNRAIVDRAHTAVSCDPFALLFLVSLVSC